MYKTILISALFITSLHGMDYDKQQHLDKLKKEYINNYSDIKEITKNKTSLLNHAPAALKQWFAKVKENQSTEPALLYGAHGVGKTLTSQALVQGSGCALCYLKGPEVMQWYQFFKQDYLEKTDENTCIVLDNLYGLKEHDIGNLSSLLDTCNKKKNLHLLAIAYHAQKNMPSLLYEKFAAIKFPVPTPQERVQILRNLPKKGSETIAHDVDSIILDQKCSNYTATEIKMLRDAAIGDFEQNNREYTNVTLSKRNFDTVLRYLDLEKQNMKTKFDENE